MSRPISKIAPDWWDYTTLDHELLEDAAHLSPQQLAQLGRPGFTIRLYDTLEEFWLAEAGEYIDAWAQSTPDNPAGICGPIGPTEQLPLVARLVNALDLKLAHAHFWGMDEWVEGQSPVGFEHPLSFARTDMQMCFEKIEPPLAMPTSQIHFPTGDLEKFSRSFDQVRCVVMQGGQGYVKHWAFNDPPRRIAPYADAPMPADIYRRLSTRITDLHPLTIVQNAHLAADGAFHHVPIRAATVGPIETWKAEKVSIWHPGFHDTQFGIRLSALMISKGIADTAVPMSLLADHPNVQFNYYRGGLRPVRVGNEDLKK